MSTCLIPQATFLPDALGAKGVIPATVYIPAPLQPPAVTVQSCSFVVVDGVEAAAIQQASMPFDYALAASFWVFAFSFTVGAWFLAKNLGLILEGIKRW